MSKLGNLIGATFKSGPQPPKNYVGQEPRFPTDEEVSSWLRAGGKRLALTVRQELKMVNPVRWKRMQGDIAWMKKELKKMGLNPDDYRWYL